MMNHMESSRMTTTRVAIAATVVVVLAFAVHDVRAQAIRHASHYEDQQSPTFTGLPGTAFTDVDYNNPMMHRTWEQLYGYMGGHGEADGLPPPKVSHGTFLADYLDEKQMAEYEEWQKNVDANNTRVLVKVNSQSFDINDELQKLRQVFEISTFADFERYGAKDFELKIRGLKPEFYNTTITKLRETVQGNRDRVGSNREHWILDNYFNSWISIENEWQLYKNMVENTVARLERLDIELNLMMRNMLTEIIKAELDREKVAAGMGTPEFLAYETEKAIMYNAETEKGSIEINGAAFVATVTFLLVLFNAYRFCMLFYKSRNTEKLVATDMTFASTD